jgi:hypothetical protein
MINYKKIYKYLTYSIYILYVLAFLGLWASAPEYLDIFQSYLKLIISLILIYYFNPFTKTNIKYYHLHKEVAFTAGIFLLTSISFDSLRGLYINIDNDIKKIFKFQKV